mgnify:CR=1 FL=1
MKSDFILKRIRQAEITKWNMFDNDNNHLPGKGDEFEIFFYRFFQVGINQYLVVSIDLIDFKAFVFSIEQNGHINMVFFLSRGIRRLLIIKIRRQTTREIYKYSIDEIELYQIVNFSSWEASPLITQRGREREFLTHGMIFWI